MLRRIKVKIQRVEMEKQNKLKELLQIQNEIKKLDDKFVKLNSFKKEYEELAERFNQFLQNEFTR